MPGTDRWEIHVFDKNNNEVGMYNHAAWFNKHGHKGEPAGAPQCVNNTLKGYAVELERKRGYILTKARLILKARTG